MYELDKAAFGHFLAQLRREKGMTQKELAATLYVSDKAVSKWERGLSVPDISLLVPLAEQLNVTVAELLQGRWVEEERRFTREETEDLIRKALTFSAEPPERRQARTKKYLPVYIICCVLGVAEALAVWAAGLADIEGALALLIIGVVFRRRLRGVCHVLDGRDPAPLLRREPHLQLCTGCIPHPHPGHLLQQPKLEARPAGVPGLVDGVAGAGAALHGGGCPARARYRLAGVGRGAGGVYRLAVRGDRDTGEEV